MIIVKTLPLYSHKTEAGSTLIQAYTKPGSLLLRFTITGGRPCRRCRRRWRWHAADVCFTRRHVIVMRRRSRGGFAAATGATCGVIGGFLVFATELVLLLCCWLALVLLLCWLALVLLCCFALVLLMRCRLHFRHSLFTWNHNGSIALNNVVTANMWHQKLMQMPKVARQNT